MDASPPDSVGIEAAPVHGDAAAGSAGEKACGRSVKGYASVKLLVAVFLIFLLVVSDIFVNNVVSGFGEKAVRGRNTTSWGTILQGIFVVLFYILVVAMIEHRVF